MFGSKTFLRRMAAKRFLERSFWWTQKSCFRALNKPPRGGLG